MSKTLSIKGAPYPLRLDDLAELCIELEEKIFVPYYEALSGARQSEVCPYQSLYPQAQAIIFDTRQYTPTEVGQIIPKITTFLDLLNITVADPETMVGGVSFKIERNPNVYQGAPSLNLCERNANVIYQVILGIRLDSGPTEVAIDQLLAGISRPEFDRLVTECTFDLEMDVRNNVVTIQRAFGQSTPGASACGEERPLHLRPIHSRPKDGTIA